MPRRRGPGSVRTRALRRSALIATGLVTMVASGCGATTAPLSPACTGSQQTIRRALRAAPRTVRLPDGSRLSQCIRGGADQADVLDVGASFTGVADALRDRAREQRDPAAAVQLGYLVGATRKGAGRTNGVMAELQRRIELVGGRLQDEVPALADAVQRGRAAGEQRG